jgi:hypothetical protein
MALVGLKRPFSLQFLFAFLFFIIPSVKEKEKGKEGKESR